jgi:hypothetical protein
MIRCGGFAAVAAAPSAADVAATSSPATSFMGALATIDGLVAYPSAPFAPRLSFRFSPSFPQSCDACDLPHCILGCKKIMDVGTVSFR